MAVVNFIRSKTKAQIEALTDSIDGGFYFASDAPNIYLGTGGVVTPYGTGDVATEIHLATPKSTPVDADELGIWDSVTSLLKKVTWANLWATLQSRFDSRYLVGNTAITGATKTKITYDSKGLVTGGEDATTADIVISTDKNYVTDAEAVVIGNTSGTNSGDQDLSELQPLDADLTAIASILGTSGLLKKTAADTWVLDTNVYLTAITKALVEAVLTGVITSHTHGMWTKSGDNVYYNGGNVGIGTTTPYQLLSIGNLRSESSGIGPLGVKSDANNIAIHIEEYGGAESWEVGVDTDGNLNFYDSNSATPNITFQDVTGNVGIGTTAPTSKFHIDLGTITSETIIEKLTSNFTSSHNYTTILIGEDLGYGNTKLSNYGYNGSYISGFRLQNSIGNGTYTTAIFTYGGAVGIGGGVGSGKILKVNGDSEFTGTLKLNGVTYTFPGADGLVDYVLTTDSLGNLSWTSKTGSGDPGTGIISINGLNPTAQFIAGTSPINVVSSGSTHTISIPTATASVNGYLTSTDWIKFNTAYSWGDWASNFGTVLGKICQGNDSRLSDARPPTAHTQSASTITDFDTEVSNNTSVASNTNKVSFDSASSGKLDGIEALADVTDSENVNNAIGDSGTISTIYNSDMIPVYYSGATLPSAPILKKISWFYIKSSLKTYFDTLYIKLNTYSALTAGSSVAFNLSTGTNKTLNVAVNTTITFSNLVSGTSGDIRLNVTSISTVSLAGTGVTFYGKGSLASLPIGVHHIAFTVISSTIIDYNVGGIYE